jgi:hypothetical protein
MRSWFPYVGCTSRRKYAGVQLRMRKPARAK